MKSCLFGTYLCDREWENVLTVKAGVEVGYAVKRLGFWFVKDLKSQSKMCYIYSEAWLKKVVTVRV
jgi:hypothetical protein